MSVRALSQYTELYSGAEKGLHSFQLSLSQKQACHLVHQGLVTKVGHTLGDPLHVSGAQELNSASEENDTSDSEEGITSGESNLQQANLSEKCLSESPTSPASGKLKSCIASTEDVDDLTEDFGMVLNGVFLERANSLPLQLRSAMKGGREKSGASPRKLTVKWAPDVYDPPPTIVSHTLVRGKRQHHHHHKSRKDKKHLKDKKKSGGSSSSRGTSTKEKKQYRKAAGSPIKCYKSFSDYDNDGFGVCSPDAYCGSSFLKESPDKVHFSLGEAS